MSVIDSASTSSDLAQDRLSSAGADCGKFVAEGARRARAGAEHCDAQRLDELAREIVRRIEALVGGAQERPGNSDQIGAERERFGNVEPVANSAAGNKRRIGNCRARINDGLGGGYAPARERAGDARAPRLG